MVGVGSNIHTTSHFPNKLEASGEFSDGNCRHCEEILSAVKLGFVD